MNVVMRNTVLILLVWLMMVGVCLGKQVYLKDGGILDSQSAWRKGDKVFVKVNRDIIAEFNLNEIDLRRTFPKSRSSSRHLPRKVTVSAATAVAEPLPVTTLTIKTPAPKPAVPSSPPPAPVTKESVRAAATEPVSPPDKAELQRRAQEAAKLMSEAVIKKDPELMKEALEIQKSTMPLQGAAMQKKGGLPIVLLLVILAVCILIIASQWIVYQKAGQAGWKCLVPFYNMYILMEISGKPGWWMFLLLIPLVGVVILLFALLSLARKFRRSELFGVGLLFLPMIFFPVLAFGGSEYEG